MSEAENLKNIVDWVDNEGRKLDIFVENLKIHWSEDSEEEHFHTALSHVVSRFSVIFDYINKNLIKEILQHCNKWKESYSIDCISSYEALESLRYLDALEWSEIFVIRNIVNTSSIPDDDEDIEQWQEANYNIIETVYRFKKCCSNLISKYMFILDGETSNLEKDLLDEQEKTINDKLNLKPNLIIKSCDENALTIPKYLLEKMDFNVGDNINITISSNGIIFNLNKE